jgi:16S rRNA (cytosine967-C5)-methyltransferase
MQRVVENAERVKLGFETVIADGREFAPETPADHVLLDAPCSATGTLRRHPDVAWHRRPRDLPNLVALQRGLVMNGAEMLKPGGQLIYCVCSLEPEEGEAMLDFIAEEVPSLEHVAFSAEEAENLPEGALQDGCVRTHPALWADRGGLDGFFIARFRKRA